MEMEDAEASLSSGSSSGSSPGLREPAAPHHEHQQPVAVTTKRRPVPRRGHTKSKSGCTSCKRRRVKCDEGRPTCGPCRRLALVCEYAHEQKDQAGALVVRISPRSPDAPGRPLRTTPGVLELADLRFFHHFLLEAYPPLPILGREVWQHVSSMSHQYQFLADALLGLGASHLNVVTSANYSNSALNHRIASISALNQQLLKAHLARADADATLGALIALTFQSAYMADGMVEFLTMVRGCVLVGMSGNFNLAESVFKPLAKEAFVEIARKIVNADDSTYKLHAAFAGEFLGSLTRLRPLCKNTAELKYLATMNKIASSAVTDPVDSFCDLSFIYNEVGELSHDEFLSLVKPDNYPSQLVLLHLLALDFVMSRRSVDQASDALTKATQGRTGFDARRSMTVTWIEKIMARLPTEYRPYADGVITFVRHLTSFSLAKNGTWKLLTLHPESNTK